MKCHRCLRGHKDWVMFFTIMPLIPSNVVFHGWRSLSLCYWNYCRSLINSMHIYFLSENRIGALVERVCVMLIQLWRRPWFIFQVILIFFVENVEKAAGDMKEHIFIFRTVYSQVTGLNVGEITHREGETFESNSELWKLLQLLGHYFKQQPTQSNWFVYLEWRHLS